MKPKPRSTVLDLFDEEFAWRRKELTLLLGDVRSAGEKDRSARIRAAIAMLYAHWEGFIKVASEEYVSYVAMKRLHHADLCAGFLSLALRSKFNEFLKDNDADAHVRFVNFLRTELDSRARIPKLGMVKTGSNLSSKRLRSLMLSLGLDYRPFELKENLIDKMLLDWRNTVAHGKWMCPKEDEFELLYQEITSLLRQFKDQLTNAVVSDGFRSIRQVT